MKHTLRAGSIEAIFGEGDLRHIRYRGSEIVQRIYVAVRDRNWSTPAGRLENLDIQAGEREFRIVFDSIHKEGDVDFRWRGTIAGTASGGISFAMDGKAHSTFLRNRIGFCVHHPLRECSGKSCVVERADGGVAQSEFPEFVAPHQPFLNVRAIAHEVAPGVRAEVRFSGEIFETEDHRNWTDANFKTYGTPLHLPFPVEVRAGEEIHQKIEVHLQCASESPEPARERLVRLRALSATGVRLPKIGLGMASDGRQLSETERQALRRLRLNHLRVDLPLSDPRSALERAALEATAIGAKLEAAVTLPCDTRELSDWMPVTDRWLVLSREEPATGGPAARALRAALGPEAFVVAGTNDNFAELNRNRPEGEGWDAACFPVNPQVHAFDDESVMANAAGQFHAVRTAMSFAGGRPIVVSPVTLRPRLHSGATDPRQKLPFCAAWTLASLKALAEAGASSVTYYETRGAGGVLDGDENYPVFDVFEAIGEFAGAQVIPCESDDVFRAAALALESGGRRRTLIANLTAERCEVEVDGQALRLAPYAVARVDREAE